MASETAPVRQEPKRNRGGNCSHAIPSEYETKSGRSLFSIHHEKTKMLTIPKVIRTTFLAALLFLSTAYAQAPASVDKAASAPEKSAVSAQAAPVAPEAATEAPVVAEKPKRASREPVKLPPPDSAHAKIIIRSSGLPANVVYTMSTSAEQCAGFEPAGVVFDSGKGVLLPWIEKMTSRLRRKMGAVTEIERMVSASQPIQIQGYSTYMESNGLFTTTKKFGPLTTRFTPAGGKTYLVKFTFTGGGNCSQELSDVTDPGNTAFVADQSILDCKRPWF